MALRLFRCKPRRLSVNTTSAYREITVVRSDPLKGQQPLARSFITRFSVCIRRFPCKLQQNLRRCLTGPGAELDGIGGVGG